MLDVTAHSQSIQLGELRCQWDIRCNPGFNVDAKTGYITIMLPFLDGKNFFSPFHWKPQSPLGTLLSTLAGWSDHGIYFCSLVTFNRQFLICNIVLCVEFRVLSCDDSTQRNFTRNVMNTISFLIFYNAFCSHVCSVSHKSQILFDLLVST